MSIREHLVGQLKIRDWWCWTFVALLLCQFWFPGFFYFALPQVLSSVLVILLALAFMPFLLKMGPSCPACRTKWKVRISQRSLRSSTAPQVNYCPYCAIDLDESLSETPNGLTHYPKVKRNLIACCAVIGTLFSVVIGMEFHIHRNFQPAVQNAPEKVVVYSTEWCGSCKKLKKCLQQNEIPFTEKDIELSTTALHEHRALRARGVPATLVGKELVHGFDRDRLKTSLNRIGYEVQC